MRGRISPRTPISRQARSPIRKRRRAQTASSVGSNPTEPTNAPVVQPGRGSRLKSGTVLVRIQPGAPSFHAPMPMVRPTDSKPVIGCSNHPRGTKRRNSKWRAAGLQPRRTRHHSLPRTTDLRLCALRSAAALQVFRYGGVDELRKSPVPKTGVSPQGPPRVEFPPPPPIS